MVQCSGLATYVMHGVIAVTSEEINLHSIKEHQKVNQLNTKDNNNTADNINDI